MFALLLLYYYIAKKDLMREKIDELKEVSLFVNESWGDGYDDKLKTLRRNWLQRELTKEQNSPSRANVMIMERRAQRNDRDP